MPTPEFVMKVEQAITSAPKATGRVLDLTSTDYACEAFDNGVRVRIASWSAYDKSKRPVVGDHLLLRNGARSSRYRVIDVDNCIGVDPPTMFIANAVFDPR